MTDPVGVEAEPQGTGEGRHLGRDHCLRTGTGGDHDAGVVDDA